MLSLGKLVGEVQWLKKLCYLEIQPAITGTYCATPCIYREDIGVEGKVLQVCGLTDQILNIAKQENHGRQRKIIDTPNGKRIVAGVRDYCDYGASR